MSAKVLTLAHPADYAKYTRNNMRDNQAKRTFSKEERTYYFNTPKFAQQNGKMGAEGHPLKRILKKNASIDKNAKPAKLPFDAATKYRKNMNNWRDGMMGEGSLAYRLQIRSRPEVQEQLRQLESEIPFDTPNRSQVIQEITDNLLRTIEQEEIKTGATEGIKQRYEIISSDARRQMILNGLLERRRQKMGQAEKTVFGRDTDDVDDNFITEDVPDFENDDIEKEDREEVPPFEDIITEGAPPSDFAISSTQFIMEEGNITEETKQQFIDVGAEQLKQNLSLIQSRIYGYVKAGEERGYNPIIRLAERIKSLSGNPANIPRSLNTSADIMAFSRETGIRPENVDFLKSIFEKSSRTDFGSKRQKYSLSGLVRANKTRGRSQFDNAAEAITINTIINNIMQGRTNFNIKQEEEEQRSLIFGDDDDGY